MPIFMDRHFVDGPDAVNAQDVAEAHLLDLQVQSKYGVRYLTYWIDEQRGHIFCLADAPSAQAAEAVHREAHGLVANEIIEVQPRAVEDFLGRLADPPGTSASRPISDSAFRTILFTDIAGSTALTQKLGDEAGMDVVRAHDEIVRMSLGECGGSEVKHTGDGIMASFASVTRAVDCAITAQRRIADRAAKFGHEALRVRIGMSAGEPVSQGNDLFGAAVQLARRICDHGDPGRILVSNVVRDLCIGKQYRFVERGEAVLKGFEEAVRLFEVHWKED